MSVLITEEESWHDLYLKMRPTHLLWHRFWFFVLQHRGPSCHGSPKGQSSERCIILSALRSAITGRGFWKRTVRSWPLSLSHRMLLQCTGNCFHSSTSKLGRQLVTHCLQNKGLKLTLRQTDSSVMTHAFIFSQPSTLLLFVCLFVCFVSFRFVSIAKK